MKKISEKIKALRLQNNLTQKELGDLLNVKDTYISKLERGKSLPSIPQLERICEALNVDLTYFILDTTNLSKLKEKGNHYKHIYDKYAKLREEVEAIYDSQLGV